MELLILCAALLPAALLLLYITRADSIQPEPKSALAKAFCWGIASTILTLIIVPFITFFYEAPDEGGNLFDAFWSSFMEAAVPEEFAKWICLYLCVRKNKYFDENVDGIVYAACVGLGFAAFENIFYVLGDEDWISTSIMRGVFAVPGHFLDAVLMGYFFSLWWFKKDSKSGFLMFAAPILAHGLYDFICFGSEVSEFIGAFSIPAIIYLLLKLRKTGLNMISKLKAEDSEMMASVSIDDDNESSSNA